MEHLISRKAKIPPILLVDENYKVLQDIYQITFKRKNFIIRKRNTCLLDPGGFLYTKTPYKIITIADFDFEFQISKIERIILNIKQGKEMYNYIMFPMWIYFVLLPKEIAQKLLRELKNIEQTDDAIHAELDEKLQIDGLFENYYWDGPKNDK